MLFELKTVQELNLREIDNVVEQIARCGYEGIILPRDGDWETYRGFCRSAGRHDMRLWLRDDIDDPSGSFGGEVTSVPSFCSEEPSLWGCDPYNSQAAEAFLSCSYEELKRELGRFLGYELAGVVTRFGKANDFFAETQLRPISEFCQNNGLELMAQTDYASPYAAEKTAFADLTGMSLAQRQRELCALYVKGVKRIAVKTNLFPDSIEAAWCAAANRLADWLEGEPEMAELGVPAAKFSGGAYLLYNDGGDTELTMNLDDLGVKYVADCFAAAVYLPEVSELTLTLKEGGCLVLLPDAEEVESMPKVLSCGVTVGEFESSGEVEFSAVSGDAYRGELPHDCRGQYLELSGDFGCALVKIGRRRQLLPLPPFTLPLFRTDEGRIAEITVFPKNEQETVDLSLNNANIVSVKNQDV